MTDVKRLLNEATPLPWRVWDAPRPGIESDGANGGRGESVVVYGEQNDMEGVQTPEDAALIVHAVNRLPDYEAVAVILERLLDDLEGTNSFADRGARAALRRLRGQS